MSETFGAAEMRELADEQGWQLANVSLPVVAEQVQRRYDDVPLDDVRAALADARAGEPSQQSASDEAPGDAPPQDERAQDGAERAASERWREVRTDAIQPGQYPPERHEEQRWMGRKDKLPFAPWGDRDAALECSHRTFATHSDDDPGEVVEECEDCQAHRDGTTTAECDHDARYKWGNEAHYITGERMDMAEDDPRLDGRVYIQADDSPPAFVDGDDVRCPETGEVHPEFLELLDRIGFTYGDVSVSDSGLHAVYNGELPGTSGQAVFDIDEEPWGANDEPPTVEIYTTKHVCVMTGRHLVDTPLEVRDWNRGALRNILEEYDALDDGNQQPEPDHDTDRELDLGDYSPTATARGESTDDVRDIVRAVDRLDASDLRLRTQQVSRDGTGWEQWDPSTYRTSSGGDSLHSPPDEPVFHDFKHGQSFGVLSLYAAEQGIIRYPWDTLAGDDWWAAVEAAREDGAPIPEYESSEPEPVSALPIPRLRSLDRDAAKRFARKRGHDWPSTKEAQRRLKNRTLQAMRVGERVIVDAPTALGKSYTVSTHYWSEENEDITGGSPVIQFHETREARDQAFRETEEHGGHGIRMLGRTEACPCAAGDHNPATEDGEEDPEQVVTVDGTPASIVLQRLCEGKGLPFSVAHTLLRKHQEQQRDDLPCEEGEGVECRAIAQWHGVPRTEEGEPAADVIHATHQFAHVPSLRKGTNMVFDERPDFQQDDLSQDRIRRAVTAFLKEVDAEVHDYEHLLTVSRNGLAPNEHDPADLAERWERLHEDLSTQPSRDWYLEHEDAHTLAPALARAILQADEEANGRRSATVPHEPPRLDAEADDDDGWNRVWVTIVLDEDNNIRTVGTSQLT